MADSYAESTTPENALEAIVNKSNYSTTVEKDGSFVIDTPFYKAEGKPTEIGDALLALRNFDFKNLGVDNLPATISSIGAVLPSLSLAFPALTAALPIVGMASQAISFFVGSGLSEVGALSKQITAQFDALRSQINAVYEGLSHKIAEESQRVIDTLTTYEGYKANVAEEVQTYYIEHLNELQKQYSEIFLAAQEEYLESVQEAEIKNDEMYDKIVSPAINDYNAAAESISLDALSTLDEALEIVKAETDELRKIEEELDELRKVTRKDVIDFLKKISDSFLERIKNDIA